MNILHDLSLADYSTMRLGGKVAHVTEIHSQQELVLALKWAKEQNLPARMIGGGSNIIWKDDGFAGLLLIDCIEGYEDRVEENSHYLNIGAGENWDSIVERTVQTGLTGIEALSLVPGTAGATPIQNVGAYGQEISQTLVSVEAYDSQIDDCVTVPGSECNFSYRDSRFKTGPDRGRFFITSLTLRLQEADPEPPFYAPVEKYFEEHAIGDPTPGDLRQAVIAIRQAKLPDPVMVSNCGSFFGNPIVDAGILARIQDDTGLEPPSWPMPGGKIKLSAAWLIDQAGFKDYHDEVTGMATWPTQPLVLVNEKADSTADLLAFKQKIVDTVQQKFQVTLTQEPELLP